MRKIVIMSMLVLMSSAILAQSNNRITTYNYQTGNLVVNTITYRVNVLLGGVEDIFLINTANMLNSVARNHTEIECAEAHFSQAEWIRIENVFRQVLPVTRRNAFRTSGWISYSIYANEAGQIQEVGFKFQRGNPITPQEIYQIEMGLKALTMQYNFPPANISCAGIVYRVISTSINISEL